MKHEKGCSKIYRDQNLEINKDKNNLDVINEQMLIILFSNLFKFYPILYILGRKNTYIDIMIES
jgi:hypothetical protein